jgi:hypothetical protein
MLRRRWITLLVVAVFAYFGVSAAPVLAHLGDESQAIALR